MFCPDPCPQVGPTAVLAPQVSCTASYPHSAMSTCFQLGSTSTHLTTSSAETALPWTLTQPALRCSGHKTKPTQTKMPQATVPATELVPDTRAGRCEQRNVIFSTWNKEQGSDGARLPEPSLPSSPDNASLVWRGCTKTFIPISRYFSGMSLGSREQTSPHPGRAKPLDTASHLSEVEKY